MPLRIIWQGLPRIVPCRTSLICAIGLLLASLPPPRSTASEEENIRRRQELWNFIPRDRRLKETLAAVQQIRPQTKSSEAIRLTQWILDQPYDAFVVTANKELVSVHHSAQAQLQAFPAEWRNEYERTFGGEARQLLHDAIHRDDERLAVEVLRRFRLTAAAEDAALWLARRWLDRGELPLALAVLVPQSSADGTLPPVSTPRLLPAYGLAKATGEARLARMIQDELKSRSEVPPPQNFPRLEEQQSSTDCLSPLDSGTTDGGRDRLPVLRPLWTTTLISPGHQKSLLPLLDSWRSQLQGMNLSAVSPNRPLVVRNQLIVRTDAGLAGFELAQGRNLWTLPCETSLATLWRDVVQTRQPGSEQGSLVSPDALQSWFGGNSQLGLLSSDGVRIYYIDSVPLAKVRASNRLDHFQQTKPADVPPRDEHNRLLALELPTDKDGYSAGAPKIAWEFGSPKTTKGKGRFFFGPPLAHAGRVLAIVECDRELRLLALQAETGRVIWEQPLAAVDRSAVQDEDRAFAACTPVLAGDLILCPTGARQQTSVQPDMSTRVLTAVDAVTGMLRWSYFDGDLPADPAGRPRGAIISRGRGGFAPVTVVHGDRILHLPVNSSNLHVLQRETGRLIRTIPRQRACSLIAATDRLAVLLEAKACRAVDYSTGMDVWRRELPPITGTGLRLGQELLIPLDRGRFGLLDLATGQEMTWQPTRAGLALGNLIACGDHVLSQSPDGIAVFPQAGFVEHLLKDPSTPHDESERHLLAAEWELSTGRLDDAEHTLEAALAVSPASEQSAQPRHLLRELLLAKVADHPEESRELFSRLRRVSVTAEEQGQLLALEARHALEARDAGELRRALDALSQLPVDMTFEAAGETAWQQSNAACCRQLLSEADRELPEFAEEFRQRLLRQAVNAGAGHPELIAFALQVCREENGIEKLRDQLARTTRQKHAAELLWQQNLVGTDAAWAASAASGLAELWSSSGWSEDAVQPLRSLLTTWEHTRLPSGKTGRQVVDQWPDRSEAKEWLRRALPPSGRIAAASIRAVPEIALPELAPPEPAKLSPAELRRRFASPDSRQKFEPQDESTMEIAWHPQGEHSWLSVFEKSTGHRIHQWQLPALASPPYRRSTSCQAHYFPIGLVGEFRGYSLLEIGSDAPAWTQRPPTLERRKSVAIVGPGGPGFVVFQVANSLSVCDPVRGHVLWQRTDLEPDCGLLSDPVCGIAGDEHCLVVFGANRMNYTVYDTMTGKQLRAAQLEPEQSPLRRTPFGRRILRMVRERSQFSARIWDPLTDKYDIQESLGDRNHLFQTISPREVAWITPNGAVTVYDVPNARRTVEAHLPVEELEKMNTLRFLKDGDRLYVNLQRNTPTVMLRDHNGAFDRSAFPTSLVRDDLFAYDVRTGRMLWRKSVPHRSLVRLEPPGLPFLVMLSLVRDRHDGNLESLLVEVWDADTGDVLGRQDRLPVDRLLSATYDGLERTVTLRGLKSRIEIAWREQPKSSASR